MLPHENSQREPPRVLGGSPGRPPSPSCAPALTSDGRRVITRAAASPRCTIKAASEMHPRSCGGNMGKRRPPRVSAQEGTQRSSSCAEQWVPSGLFLSQEAGVARPDADQRGTNGDHSTDAATNRASCLPWTHPSCFAPGTGHDAAVHSVLDALTAHVSLCFGGGRPLGVWQTASVESMNWGVGVWRGVLPHGARRRAARTRRRPAVLRLAMGCGLGWHA